MPVFQRAAFRPGRALTPDIAPVANHHGEPGSADLGRHLVGTQERARSRRKGGPPGCAGNSLVGRRPLRLESDLDGHLLHDGPPPWLAHSRGGDGTSSISKPLDTSSLTHRCQGLRSFSTSAPAPGRSPVTWCRLGITSSPSNCMTDAPATSSNDSAGRSRSYEPMRPTSACHDARSTSSPTRPMRSRVPCCAVSFTTGADWRAPISCCRSGLSTGGRREVLQVPVAGRWSSRFGPDGEFRGSGSTLNRQATPGSSSSNAASEAKPPDVTSGWGHRPSASSNGTFRTESAPRSMCPFVPAMPSREQRRSSRSTGRRRQVLEGSPRVLRHRSRGRCNPGPEDPSRSVV